VKCPLIPLFIVEWKFGLNGVVYFNANQEAQVEEFPCKKASLQGAW